MAYGFVITKGEGNQQLDGVLLDSIAEVRVEQELSKSTKFAIRFEEDICEGQPTALSATSLRPGEMLAVLVPGEDNALICLGRGTIGKLKSSSVVGGPGSWLEVHCEDRRIVMDRDSVTAAWEGTATSIAEAVFTLHDFIPDVKSADDPTFDTEDQKLNQAYSDLHLVEELGRRLGYEFWLTYRAEGGPLPNSGYEIDETANFKPSPDYAAAGGGIAGAALPTIDLLSGGGKTLHFNVPAGQCRNLTAFNLDVDIEKATAALIGGQDASAGEADSDEAEDESAPVDPAADETIRSFGVTRTIAAPAAGSAADRATETRAALAAEAWFVTATASTSAHLLPGVVQPHEIVSVEGMNFAHAGRYQVAKVLHVINSWGHLMDLTLRRNALPSGANG